MTKTKRSKPSVDSKARAVARLRELAAAQNSAPKRWSYTRAADAVLALAEPLEYYLLPDGRLRKLEHVGPSSERVILEVLGDREPSNRHRPERSTIDIAASRDPEHFLSATEVVDALTDTSLKGPGLDDYRGDLQMHSTWSDGTVPVAGMVDACRARGYEFCAITDHSYGLPVAHGVSMPDLKRQHREIDALNRRLKKRFRVFKGIEANILADGRLDMSPEEIAAVEIVVASPHSGLRGDADQTTRMLRVVSTPGVHILGHPRGRKRGVRPGVRANWRRIFERAARTGVAIELDGDPRRQDIDYSLAADALAAGCFFALDSDAHAPDELAFADVAVAHARLAGIPITSIVNCWPLEHVLEWMRLRSIATGP